MAFGGWGCQGWGDRPSISAGPILAERADPASKNGDPEPLVDPPYWSRIGHDQRAKAPREHLVQPAAVWNLLIRRNQDHPAHTVGKAEDQDLGHELADLLERESTY